MDLLQSASARARRFLRTRAANVAIIAGLTAPVFVGALGLGAETGLWYVEDSRLRQAADIAAYAGASELVLGADDATVRSVALDEAGKNGWDASSGVGVVNLPPQSGAHRNANSVEVLLTLQRPRLFSALYMDGPLTLRARGVATSEPQGRACVLALSGNASRAANFSGNGQLTLHGCSIVSNSVANDSVRVAGSAIVTTECVYTAGGVDAGAGLIVTACSAPREQTPPTPDPFRNTPFATAPSGACVAGVPNPLPNVKYCSLSLSGVVALAPGDYFVDGGTFHINSNAQVSGAGVTFHLLNGATADFNGTAEIDLTAPTSGPRSGMLFMSNSTTGINRFNGTANSRLTGVLYFPHNKVVFNGAMAGSNGCLHIVSHMLDFTGNSTLSADCTAYGINPTPARFIARLVE